MAGRKRKADSGCAEESSCTFRAVTDASRVLRALIVQLAAAAAGMATPPSLTALEMRNLGLCAVDIAEGDQTAACTTLCTILFGKQAPWSLVRAPAAAPPLLTSLTLLDLECNPLHDDGVQALCVDVLPRLPHLSRLHLASTEMTASGLYYLVDGLCRTTVAGGRDLLCPSIAVVGLTNNALDISEEAKVGATTVAELLLRLVEAHARTIERVHLNHAGLSTNDVAPLIARLASKPPSAFPQLDTIYLRQNNRIDPQYLRGMLASACEPHAGAPQRINDLLSQHIQL